MNVISGKKQCIEARVLTNALSHFRSLHNQFRGTEVHCWLITRVTRNVYSRTLHRTRYQMKENANQCTMHVCTNDALILLPLVDFTFRRSERAICKQLKRCSSLTGLRGPGVFALHTPWSSVARCSRPMPILVIFLTETSPPSVFKNLDPSVFVYC
jgi:hypothetical protein